MCFWCAAPCRRIFHLQVRGQKVHNYLQVCRGPCQEYCTSTVIPCLKYSCWKPGRAGEKAGLELVITAWARLAHSRLILERTKGHCKMGKFEIVFSIILFSSFHQGLNANISYGKKFVLHLAVFLYFCMLLEQLTAWFNLSKILRFCWHHVLYKLHLYFVIYFFC